MRIAGKSGQPGKLPGAEPLMAGWFAQLLAEIDPQPGECLAAMMEQIANSIGRLDAVVNGRLTC